MIIAVICLVGFAVFFIVFNTKSPVLLKPVVLKPTTINETILKDAERRPVPPDYTTILM
jgi:hypothetical protein